MRTFGYGSRTVTADSIETGLEICRALDRLDAAKERRNQLRSVQHGHHFGPERRCQCGMYEHTYRFNCRDDTEICPLASPRRQD